MFICYYNDGTDSCPEHKHGCRQITVSFGETRVLKVNTKEIELESGHAIILHKQKHGVPKSTTTKPRLSFNLFFTTDKEMGSPTSV
jgi:hypothetical protein